MYFQKNWRLQKFLFAIIMWTTFIAVSIAWHSPKYLNNVLKSYNQYKLSPYFDYENSRHSVPHVTDRFDNVFQANHVFSEIRPFISSNINASTKVLAISDDNVNSDICLPRPQPLAAYFVKTVHAALDKLRHLICSLLDYLIVYTKKYDSRIAKIPEEPLIVIPQKNLPVTVTRTRYVAIVTSLPTVTHIVTRRLTGPITKTVTTVETPTLKRLKKSLPNVIVVPADNTAGNNSEHVVKIQFKLPDWVSEIFYP